MWKAGKALTAEPRTGAGSELAEVAVSCLSSALQHIVEHRSGAAQIVSLESFLKAVKCQREKVFRLLASTRLMPNFGEAYSGAQLPGQCALAERPVESLHVLVFRGHLGPSRRAFETQQVSPDAQQL